MATTTTYFTKKQINDMFMSVDELHTYVESNNVELNCEIEHRVKTAGIYTGMVDTHAELKKNIEHYKAALEPSTVAKLGDRFTNVVDIKKMLVEKEQ